MKEVKYLSHFSRNIYIYFFVFLINILLFKTTITVLVFFLGLFIYFIAYAPVYFLNDFADYKEDYKYKKSNLYLLFQNKKKFWTVTLFLLLLGLLFSFTITPLSAIFLIVLYVLNFMYSYPPFRLRNRLLLREILIFIIYFVKCWLVLLYLHQSILNFPLAVIVMGSSIASYGVAIYKRYLGKTELSGAIFGAIFVVSWFWTIFVYKQLFWLLLPLVPVSIFLYVKYKDKQIPIGVFQNIYFLYCILIYAIHLYSIRL